MASERSAESTGKGPGDPAPPGLQPLPQPQADGGLSLTELSAAFAEMLSSGANPYVDEAAASSPLDPQKAEQDTAPAAEPCPEDDACELSPRSILEAMLFVGYPGNEPLSSETVAGLMRGVRPSEIDDHVRELNRQYAESGCPYEIVGQGAGYRLALRPKFERLRARLYGRIRQTRLSAAAVEVLSVVAYQGPLSGEDVSRARGAPSGSILAQLVRRELLAVERSEAEKRTILYRTTDRFLRLFGLASLEELPRSQDLSHS